MPEDEGAPLAPLKVTDPYEVPVTFVNDLVGRGFLNGNVNLTFATARWTPNDGKIDTDLVITSRLRLDLFCAIRLRDELAALITSQTQNTKAN